MAKNKTYYVKHWRLIRDMTQGELAKKTQVRRATILDIEKGHSQPRPETLEAIMRVLNVTDAQIARDPFARFNSDE